MAWPNGPHARQPGTPAAPERLPRAIGARLARAGLVSNAAPKPAGEAAASTAAANETSVEPPAESRVQPRR